jgi:hypothetical protein
MNLPRFLEAADLEAVAIGISRANLFWIIVGVL